MEIISANEDVEKTGVLWELTPADWTCPVCNRPKPDLVRIANGGGAARLVEHHDHIEQFIDNEVRRIAKQKAVSIDASLGVFLKTKLCPFITRFDRIVICEDCNNADPAAKAIHHLDQYFTFTPLEIAQFIKVAPGCKHQIDEKALALIVESIAPVWVRLKSYTLSLIERHVDGLVWGEDRLGPGRSHYSWMLKYARETPHAFEDVDLYSLWRTDPTVDRMRLGLDKSRLKRQKRLTSRRAGS